LAIRELTGKSTFITGTCRKPETTIRVMELRITPPSFFQKCQPEIKRRWTSPVYFFLNMQDAYVLLAASSWQ
jgi:hypothetical protein